MLGRYVASATSGFPDWPNCWRYCAWRSLIPSTEPLKLPVARKLSRQGTVTENRSWVPSNDPIVNNENGAQLSADS